MSDDEDTEAGGEGKGGTEAGGVIGKQRLEGEW